MSVRAIETPGRLTYSHELEVNPKTPLGALYQRRVDQNQDLVILISDWHNRRGTGKTALSLKLAAALDRTEEGLTSGKCFIDPRALSDAYVEQPRGSALVLDEAEAGLSKYRSGSNVNLAVRQLVSMGRVEEKYLILNLPASAEIDRDLKALCDVWILVEIKGRAIVHNLKYNPYQEKPYAKIVQDLSWGDIPTDDTLRDIYNDLTEEKRRRLRGEEGDGFVNRSQLEARIKKAKKEARRETRDELIRAFASIDGLNQQEVGEAAGLSRSRISHIVNGH